MSKNRTHYQASTSELYGCAENSTIYFTKNKNILKKLILK